MPGNRTEAVPLHRVRIVRVHQSSDARFVEKRRAAKVRELRTRLS